MEKHNAKRTALIALCSILAVLLAALLVGIIVTNHLLDQVQRPEDTTLSSSEIEEILEQNPAPTTTILADTTETTETTEAIETTEPTQNTEEVKVEAPTNILLIGQTANSSASWKNSEVMILCTVDKSAKTLKLTSFQRDAVVKIPGYGDNKLSVAYSIGGMKLLDQCLEANYGVQVDANIAVNFNGLMDLVDMLGGVTIELTAQEASYLNAHGNWGYTNTGGWSLQAGTNTLSGEKAMGYALIKQADGEAGRNLRQRKVIAALVEQAEKLSATQMYDLVEQILGCVTTDMTNSQILGYIAEFAPVLTELQLIS